MHFARTSTVVAMTALSVAAHAQNNVQLYGLMDAGVEYVDKVRVGGVGSATESMVRVQSGSAQSSRFGLRGREDLGDGLTAVFALESGISIDSGTLGQNGRLFGRHAYVGLNHRTLGEIELGREATTFYDYGVQYDPITASRYSAVVFDAAYVGRADNAVKYVGKFGGFSVGAQYSFGLDGTIAGGSEVPGAYRVGKETGMHVSYVLGKAQFGVVYDRQNGTSIATERNTTERKAVGGAISFPSVKLFASYQRTTAATPASSRDTNLYWVGAQYSPVAAFTVTPTLYVNDPEGAANKSTMLAFLANYALSKRTDLYSQLAFMRNQDQASMGMGGAVNPGDRQGGVILGIRHRF
ncbi:porin [Herbaspirillum sp. SJZ107]|uniref:porin n=1 Tax=Herbaspirillum sp. SJZ107 TaxID=2572881 RepID=UPI001153FC54|nr:porin [Herbaspirillum sp. SJZ107]TQK01124.1 putative porin [Herbaspirillum sp. SJZ107]